MSSSRTGLHSTGRSPWEDPEFPAALQEELRGMGVRAEGMELDLSSRIPPRSYSMR